MPNYSHEELLERYEKLPSDIRTAMGSVSTVNAVQSISNRHGLHVDQMGILAEEIGYLMLGVRHPREFVGSLTTRLNIDRHVAELIAHDANENIFLPVRAYLKELHRLRDDELDAAMRGMDRESLIASIEAPSAPKETPPTPTPATGAPATQKEEVTQTFAQEVAPLFRAPQKRTEIKTDPYREALE